MNTDTKYYLFRVRGVRDSILAIWNVTLKNSNRKTCWGIYNSESLSFFMEGHGWRLKYNMFGKRNLTYICTCVGKEEVRDNEHVIESITLGELLK